MDGSGNVYVTGWSYGSGTGYDYATVRYDADGVQQWVARYDGPASGDDYGQRPGRGRLGQRLRHGVLPGSGTGSTTRR